MSNGWYQLEREKRQKATARPMAGQTRRPPCPPGPRVAPPPPPVPAACAEPEAREVPAACSEPEVREVPAACSEPEVRQEPQVRAAPPAPEACPAPEAAPPAPAPEPPGPRAEEPAWERAGAALPDSYRDMPTVLHSQTVGPDGPVVVQDLVLHETLDGFVHEKTVERAVHVKGWGALGRFTCEHDMSAHTMLPFLQRPGTRVDTASRFSLAVSNRGTPDTSRNVRGFSTKFYTPDGVFDLLCNHLPVFSVRDAIRFPESIRAFLPSPTDGLIDPQRFWDFVARAPESTAFVTRLYSDQGTVKSLRRLRAYGVNTYVWRNRRGERRYVKYHWLPKLGAEYITAEEAARLACRDPDYAGRDLRDAIARGEGPCYELNVQLMDPGDAGGLTYDPLDDTKVWSEADYPLCPVGTLVLDRNPEDYAGQVEKLAFSPSNLLPGAELSDDKMLQGRSFVYWDAQRYRLGPSFRDLPVNGQKGWRPDCQVSSGLGTPACGDQVRADISRQDDFTQAGEFYRALAPEERERLAANLAEGLSQAPAEVRRVVLGYLARADGDYGAAVERKMR